LRVETRASDNLNRSYNLTLGAAGGSTFG